MKFDFDFAMSVDIDEKVIKEMISHCVQEQTGRTVKEVEFTIKQESHGDQRENWITSELTGATVTLDVLAKEPYRPKQPQPYDKAWKGPM